MKSFRQRTIDGLQVGDQFTISRTLTPEEIQRFADISRDYNPVHLDRPYAELRNFRAPVSHGLLTASLLTEIGGQIAWLATGMSFRFKHPVYAGEQITCTWDIKTIDERGHASASVRITNPEGLIVLEAETTGVLPRNRLAKLGVEPIFDSTPERAAAFVQSETRRWAEIIRAESIGAD